MRWGDVRGPSFELLVGPVLMVLVALAPARAVTPTAAGAATRPPEAGTGQSASSDLADPLEPEATGTTGALTSDVELKRLDQRVAATPKDPEVHIQRGLALLRSRRTEEALRDFNEAIRLDPSCAKAYNQRGLVFRSKNDLERALADLTEAIRLDPRLVSARRNRAVVSNQLKRGQNALADADWLIRQHPDDASAYVIRSVAHRITGRMDLASADLTAAIGKKPGYIQAYLARGALFEAQRRYDRAIEDYTTCIRQDPINAKAYSRRAWSHWRRNAEAAFRADTDRTLALNPLAALVWANLAVVDLIRGHVEMADEELEECSRLSPRMRPQAEAACRRIAEGALRRASAEVGRRGAGAPSFVRQGLYQGFLKRHPEALRSVDAAIRLAPRLAPAHRARGYVRLSMGETDRAIADLNAAIGLDPGDATSYRVRARARLIKNDVAGAIGDLKEAARRAPGEAVYGRICRMQLARDAKGALETARAGLSRFGDSRALKGYLALSLLYCGQFDQARPVFEELAAGQAVGGSSATGGLLREISGLEREGFTHPDVARARDLLLSLARQKRRRSPATLAPAAVGTAPGPAGSPTSAPTDPGPQISVESPVLETGREGQDQFGAPDWGGQ